MVPVKLQNYEGDMVYMIINSGNELGRMPEKYVKIVKGGTRAQGWKSISDTDRELAYTRVMFP